MEALVFRGEGVRFERVAVPQVDLGPGEALAAVELATICGSDVHTVLGHRSAPAPLVLGHEQVGRIVALGPGRAPRTVDGAELKVGDRVVWGVAVDCGRCRYCTAGLPQKCASLVKYGHERIRRGWELSGGFASHVHLRARTPVVVVAEEVPAAVLAPAGCATATVMAALAAASAIRPLEGAVVAVSGCGMLGLTAVAAARARGATVVASDPDPRRRALALGFGASAVGDGGREGIASALAAARARNGYTVALEVSGAPAAVQSLPAASDIGAVLVLVGSVFPAGTVAVDPELVVRRMLTVRGVHNYAPQHLLEAAWFLEQQADHAAFGALVGATHSLDAFDEALDEARTGGAARVGLDPGPRAVTLVG
ncbi:alcohol dehydrogenase [Protaetiibacter intestinalis]|uniref:alcohol dehydrogenase n=2 Tax=Protaetiibacter intestinalis TaxID=2419774 RepID=A0A387B6S9_9MICO|nr:alcohol dehydrogenase [Protaetiibacter intestinalis]